MSPGALWSTLFGMVLLSPVFLIITLWILIDDPGSVFFTQKMAGRNKRFFRLHKFRSMKMSTPANTPTHMLNTLEFYITRVGRVLRKTSLDEFPQVWDIWIGNMSVIGVKSALWNQDCLVALRDGAEGKRSANDVRPGLIGAGRIIGTTVGDCINVGFYVAV